MAPRYRRSLSCNDPVRRSALSVAKVTGLTTAENSSSRGRGNDAAATAAARSWPSSLTRETILPPPRVRDDGAGMIATGERGQSAGDRSIIRT